MVVVSGECSFEIISKAYSLGMTPTDGWLFVVYDAKDLGSIRSLLKSKWFVRTMQVLAFFGMF